MACAGFFQRHLMSPGLEAGWGGGSLACIRIVSRTSLIFPASPKAKIIFGAHAWPLLVTPSPA
jgi:hypothetical protein